MRLRGLELQVVQGCALHDDDIDAMWALRARFMALKPDVRAEDDRALFAAWMRMPGGTVALGRDRAGAIQVFIEMKSRLVEHRGRKWLVLFGNFVFASEAYRSHPAYVIGNLWNLALHTFRRPSRRILWVVPLYPPSFVAGARTFETTWIAGEAEVPEDIESVVDSMVPELYGDGWLPERKLLRMRTLPRPYVPSSPTTART